MLDECLTNRVVVLGFDLAGEKSDGTRTLYLPIANFMELLGAPDPVSATVAEARRLLHDALPATEVQRAKDYPPASLVSLVLKDEEALP